MTKEEIIFIKEDWYGNLEYPHIAVDIAEAIKIVEKSYPHAALADMYDMIEVLIFDELQKTIAISKKYGHTSKIDRLEELLYWLTEVPRVMIPVIQFYRWKHDKKYYPETIIPIEKQPPSEKQLSYLRALGCNSIPDSKKSAMTLISQYLEQRVGV